MTTWAELNKQTTGKTATLTSKKWDVLNAEMSKQAYQQEAYSQQEIDPELFKRLKEQGVKTSQISTLAPEKVSYLQQLGSTAKENVGGLFGQMFRDIRGISQVAATPLAGAMALVPGGATPKEAMKESLRMAKEVVMDKKSIDKGVEDAAQMWLKNRGVGKYGGKDPDIADVAALGMLGFFNLFGDPAFEFGVGLKGVKALKEFATFKKVGQVTKEFPEGTKIIQGIEREMAITDDLKIKIKPKTNEVVFEGYKKRFPTQKALPDSQMAKETQDLVVNTREATGMELQAKFVGDDLVITPTTPIAKSVQPVVKAIDPLISEARKYKSAEEFVNETHGATYRTVSPEEWSGVQKTGKFEGRGIRPGTDKADITWVSTDPKSAQIYNRGGDRFTIKFKDEAKVKSKTQIEGSKVSDRMGENLTMEDVAKVYDQNGNVVYEASDLGKTKSQLTDIWNKAQEKVEIPKIEPEIKKSKLGIRVKEEAIEEGLVKQMRGLPEYETMNMKEQAQLASELINSDLEKAKRVAMGQEMPDGKLLPESVFIAMKNWAKQNKDVALIRQLAKSHTVEEATFMGQRIRALGETDPHDPVKIIREISEARAKKSKVTKKELTAEEKKIQQEIRKVKKTEKDLEDFIQAIKC